MTPATERLQIRTDPEMNAWLEERSEIIEGGRGTNIGPSIEARTELMLFKMLIDAELRRLTLSLGEARLLATLTSDQFIGRRPNELANLLDEATHMSHQEGIAFGEAFGVSESGLLKKLRTAGPTFQHALEFALKKWTFANENVAPMKATADSFAAAGLRIVDGDVETRPRAKRIGR